MSITLRTGVIAAIVVSAMSALISSGEAGAKSLSQSFQGTVGARSTAVHDFVAGPGPISVKVSCERGGQIVVAVWPAAGGSLVTSAPLSCAGKASLSTTAPAGGSYRIVVTGGATATPYGLDAKYKKQVATTSTSVGSTSTTKRPGGKPTTTTSPRGSSTTTTTSPRGSSTTTTISPGSSSTTTTTLGNGGGDQTSEVQALVDATADGGTVDGGGRTFRAGDTLILDTRNNLTVQNLSLDGSAPRSDRRHVDVKGGTNITFRNVTITGAGQASGLASREREYGFQLRGVDGFTAEDCAITNVGSDFFNVTGQGSKMPSSKNVLIKNCTLDGAGRQGIAGSGASGLTIQGNTIRGVKRTTFDFEAEDGGARDVVIADNDILQAERNQITVLCRPLNQGPFTIDSNRVYGAKLGITGETCSYSSFVITNNVENLPTGTFP